MLINKGWAALILVGMLQGCASVGVDQMTFGNNMIATAHNGYPFDETPVKQVKQSNSLIVVTHVKWDVMTEDAGMHAVSWTWYNDGKVVALRHKDMRFRTTPYRFFWRMPATDFEPGHYRVDVAIDNKIVDTQEYDIVK